MENTNLIGISGRAGSGKDTIGAIIQYLTATDTSNKALGFIKLGYDIKGHHNSTFEIKKFAGKLKTMASLLTGIPVEKFEDQEFKKQEMPEEWWYKNVYDAGWDKKWTKETINYPTHTSTESHIVKTTYRQFLQNLGTEAMRDGLHTNVWVNALFADYAGRKTRIHQLTPVKKDFDVDTHPNWIITDMRFPNEMEAIEERGGITIRVVREHDIKVQRSGNSDDYAIEKFDKTNPKHVALKLAESSRLHPSETALDDAEFHYTIENDGTLEELIEKVKRLLFIEGIL